jgi:hypothetical protein
MTPTPTTLRLATRADDPALRRILRENPMPGAISLTFEREPDYFIAAGVDGSLSQTILNQEMGTGEILGMGTRIVRPMYLNGQAQDVGYMSHLRADSNRSWGLSLARQLARSFTKFHELHADGRVPFYLMSVIADNAPARRLLASGLPGMPHAREYARMFTYAISPRRPRHEIPLPRGMQIERGKPEQIPAIIECLQRNNQRMQFSPFWSTENLFIPAQTPNLHPQDFFLAIRSGQVIGCLALWDQTSFKQTVVRGYTGNMARWRPLINLLSRIVDLPYLPAVGSPIPFCYASHLAIDNDDARIFASLLRAIYNETARREFNYFMLGLSENHPLRPVLTKNYLHITYPSQIYLMAWDDGLDALTQVDGRIPALEIAIL